MSFYDEWRKGKSAAVLLKEADRTVAHLTSELRKAVEDGHTMYQRGLNVGRQGAAGGRQI